MNGKDMWLGLGVTLAFLTGAGAAPSTAGYVNAAAGISGEYVAV
jgi:hypothetical protein